MQRSVCLAVDESCIQSFNVGSGYQERRTGKRADFRGYVVAVDPNYDPDNFDKSDSLGYRGQVKVLDQLIMTDLYPFLASQCQFLEDIWRQARRHPCQVYVGPILSHDKDWRNLKEQSAEITVSMVQLFTQLNPSRA
jgi:hypothetical protein